MGINTGILKFVLGIIGGIGSILFLIGFFSLASKGEILTLALGTVLYIAAEIGNIYFSKYEEKKQLDMFRINFWNMLGANYALPVLLFALYLLSPSKFTLLFSMALSAQAVIKTAAIILKCVYIENLAG